MKHLGVAGDTEVKRRENGFHGGDAKPPKAAGKNISHLYLFSQNNVVL